MRFGIRPAEVGRKQGQARHRLRGAQAIWEDPDRLEIQARSLDEPRSQVIGRIDQNTWSAFITYRHETIRIISVRRARPEEEARYLVV
jgi:uncharacterized DUF497 family protein